jgi:Glyoxalase-like domain
MVRNRCGNSIGLRGPESRGRVDSGQTFPVTGDAADHDRADHGATCTRSLHYSGVVNARIDHLVFAADSLKQGEAWCEATFGVQPSGGGKHALMGTHNQVMNISTERFPDCYLEIIAIDPEATAPGRSRWFGLDQPALREAVGERPRLVHAVARTRMSC